jgi:hypothetical protein
LTQAFVVFRISPRNSDLIESAFSPDTSLNAWNQNQGRDFIRRRIKGITARPMTTDVFRSVADNRR